MTGRGLWDFLRVFPATGTDAAPDPPAWKWESKSCVMEITGTISAILERKGGLIWHVTPDSTVFDAIRLMAEKNVGALLVMNGDTLMGVVSERDYTRKVAM